MKKYIILLAAAAMVLGACSKKEFIDQPQQGEVKIATLTCSLPVDETKATLNGQGKVAWSEGDSIVVWNYINGTVGESTEKIYKLVSGAGTATGVFQGEAFATGVARVAMYPVSFKKSFQGTIKNRVIYHVPATIQMTSADDNQDSYAPLFAYIPDQTKPFFFEHGGSVVRLQFRDIPASARKIKIYQPEAEKASETNYRAAAICGTRFFSATNLKGAGKERLGNTGNNSSPASHVNFSLAFPGGKEGPGLVSGKGVFYFPIPVSSSVKTRKFKVAFLDKNDIQIEGTQREFTTDTLKAGIMLSKPEISAWAIDTTKKGNGTEADPYLIFNKADLCKMGSQVVADSVTYFKMMDDVDMTGVTDWAPANQADPFNVGINFNGNGHTICNFSCNPGAGIYAGLIGVLYGKVYDLTFKNPVITANKAAGVVCGYAGTGSYTGDIENVNVVNGTVTQNGTAHSGLIFGTNGIPGTYTNCHTSGTVKHTNTGLTNSNSSVGGIAGSSVASTFERCSFVGELIGCRNSGGIVGYERTAGSTINECWTDVKMKMTKMGTRNSDNNGGIVGFLQGGTITNCYSKGSVSQTQQTCGGIAAEVISFSTVKNCWSSATIAAARVAGGIVGRASNNGWSTDSDKCLDASGCIYWGTKIDVTSATDGNGSSGSIVGFNTLKNVVADCWRINDSTFTFVTGNTHNFPADQPNGCSGWVKGTTPQVGTGVAPQQYLFPYWGKAAAEDATVSSVAQTLSWDTTIWDLSKEYPTLKNNPEK